MTSVASLWRLTDLVPPPDLPVQAHGDWKRFVSVNGFPPPEDYRMLIREYGAGTFGRWLRLIEPFDHTASFMDKVYAEYRVLRSRGGPDWPLWPEPGGFLPWATTATGDHVGWRTTGHPDAWPTVFWCSDQSRSCEYPLGAVGFIVGLFERTLGAPAFDRNGPLDPAAPAFEPIH